MQYIWNSIIFISALGLKLVLFKRLILYYTCLGSLKKSLFLLLRRQTRQRWHNHKWVWSHWRHWVNYGKINHVIKINFIYQQCYLRELLIHHWMRLTHSDNGKMQDQDQGKWLQKVPMHWFYSKLSRNFGVSIAIKKCASLRQVQFKEIYNV